MQRFHYQQATGMASSDTTQRISSNSPARSASMRPAALFARSFQRVLLVMLAVIGLVSAFTLTPATPAKAASSKQAQSSQVGHSAHALAPRQALSSSLSGYPANGSNDVTYHGGSVIHNPKVFLIFEGTWAAGDMQTVKQYFIDVSGSYFEGILTQYADSSGSISYTITVSGSVMDANPFHSDYCGKNTISDDGAPTIPLDNNDIYNEIIAYAPIDSSTVYFVFTPPGYSDFGPNDTCSSPECGYHNNFPGGAIYAVIPWGGGACTNDSTFPPYATNLDKTINTASHEQFEAISNPVWTIFQQQGGGWYNTTDCGSGHTCEIGDKCGNEHLGILLNGDAYPAVQGEYSNATHDCEYPAIPPVVNVPSGGAFYTVWQQQMGGIHGTLGGPIDSWYTITGGQEQDFQYGRIYWSSSTGTHEVQGAILSEYLHTGGPAGALNFPTSNEQNAYNSSGGIIGRENTFRGSGCTTNYQGSIIIWSSSTGAHEVDGCIYQKYLALGGTASFLGLPTTDEQAVNGGHASYFQGTACGSSSGSGIFDGPGAGVHEVHGCIYAKYRSLGGPAGALNFPTSDEQNAYASSGIAVGRENTFRGTGCTANDQGSIILWGSSSGTHEVDGCIYQKYLALGGTASFLGLPISDEVVVSSGHASYFQGTACGSSGGGGAIFDEPGAGIHETHGCIYQHYESLLQSGVPLGYPTSDEQNVYNSSGVAIGRENTFSGSGIGCGSNTGSAIISSSTGTYAVQSCIYQAYISFGGASSALGLPVGDQFGYSGGLESDFQNGYIDYLFSTNQTYIYLYTPGCNTVPNC